MCHVSCVTCHLSRLTCHLSRVTCHMSPVTCQTIFFLLFIFIYSFIYFLDKVVELVDGGSVINRSYPRLVFKGFPNLVFYPGLFKPLSCR